MNSVMSGSDDQNEVADDDRLGMTDDQWAQWQKYTHGYGEQDENGVDIAAIRRNLRLTPSERLSRLEQAVNSMRKLQRHAGTTG